MTRFTKDGQCFVWLQSQADPRMKYECTLDEYLAYAKVATSDVSLRGLLLTHCRLAMMTLADWADLKGTPPIRIRMTRGPKPKNLAAKAS